MTRWALLASLLTSVPATAALDCSAQLSRTSVPRGGELVLQVTASGDVGWSVDFELPDLPGLRVYDGGTSQNMTMINGATRTAVTRSWYLRVETDADFTIGPVAVSARGETCRTDPLRVEVLDEEPVPPADSGNRRAAPPDRPSPRGDRPADEIFVTLDVDKQQAWVGEQIILSFRYWRRVQPWNNPSYEAPRTEGFWREDLGPERTYRQVLDGRAYNVTEIRYALFPARAGRLVVEPATLTFPEDVFDRFFNSRRRSSGPRTLRTDPVTIDVRPLPEPAPEGYAGLVANDLELTASVDRDSVRAGEPAGLTVALRTDGFLKGFGGLTVRAPDRSRLHDAAESFETGLAGERLRGSLRVEKVIVPEEAGVLAIPPVRVVWFDADRGRYATAVAAPPALQVLPGEGGGAPDRSGFLRSEIARLGEDLAFIHPVPRKLRRGDEPFTGSAAWWGLLLAPAVLLASWRLVLVRLSAERRDPRLRRRRRALATAREHLRAAAADHADAPGLLVRAVCGYVADCLGRPRAAIGATEVAGFCRRLGLPELGDELAALLDASEAARYGGTDPASRDGDLQRAGEILGMLAQAQRRRTAADGAVPVVLLAALVCAAGVAASRGVTPEQLVAEGNRAYTEGELEAAQELYEAARRAGANDPVLHYNLGNVHARRGELGRALASYERARRLDPRDHDLASNTAWVRRQLRDLELASNELPLFIRQFVQVVRLFTLDQWGTLSLVAVWSLAGLVALAWGRERFGDAVRRAALTLGGLAVVCLAVTAWRWHGERRVDAAMVQVPEASVRSGPDEDFPALFTVHDGLPVVVRSSRDEWVRISLGGDWQGWLPESAVVRVREPDQEPAR